MSDRIDSFLSDWMDDADEVPRNEPEISAVESSERVADALLIHGLLTEMAGRDQDGDAEQMRSLMQRINSEVESNTAAAVVPNVQHGRGLFAIVTSAFTIAAAVMVMFFVFSPNQSVSAAMASLEKVVEAAMRPLDRTYSVRVVEEYSRDKRPRNLSQEAWDRQSPEQIDGATIYVRGANKYVLKVLLTTGEASTSGCDGKLSWSLRQDGPVHVSADLNRFRGRMPGSQHDMPFMNIHANLSQLRVGYDVELTDEKEAAADGLVLSQLICVRKSNDVRGTKRVEIWFAPESGTVHKMLLDGLPRGRGGPKSVMLELIDQSDLDPDFFSHEAHHEPERKIKSE